METYIRSIPVIVLAGPTAVGKTSVSIELAKEFSGEIINGDSMQVYRGLDIGTGKIEPREMQGIPHHLFDIREVDQSFDASQFQDLAHEKILEIHQRGHLPIIVGGTGLYLEGLLYQLEFGHAGSTDSALREQLQQEAEEVGREVMWQRLNAVDPEAADKIPQQNLRRIIRALEMIELTGQLFSSQQQHQVAQSRYNDLLIIMNRERELLYDRINRRVCKMIETGLEAEARNLFQRAQNKSWQSSRGIGYKEWEDYFQGQLTQDQVIAKIQQNSRRYAKRQLTWFRNRMQHPLWLSFDHESMGYCQLSQAVEAHLTMKAR